MSNKGFVSGYYLVLFMLLLDLTAIGTAGLIRRAAALENLRTANRYLHDEAESISELKEFLKNCTDPDEMEAEYTVIGSQIYIQTGNPEELLIVTINRENMTVYDYEVQRNEKPSYME